MSYQSTTLFDDISPEECSRMLSCFGASEQKYAAGDIICDYQYRSDKIGIIQSGTASLVRIDAYGIRTILEELGPGAVFGSILTYSGAVRDSISVVCEEKCFVLFIGYERIVHPCTNACTHHSVLLQNMFRLITGKAIALSERVEVLSRRTIRDKLLCYFFMRTQQEDSNSFLLPFSVSMLADYICSDRSAMMREMKNMREEGLIESTGRKITLINV